MIHADTIKHVCSEITFDESKRSISFETHEHAIAFVKDLLEGAQEIVSASVSTSWFRSIGGTKQKIKHCLFEVQFNYNCHIAKDKKHLQSVLNKHRNHIIIATT